MNKYSKPLIVLSILAASLLAGSAGGSTTGNPGGGSGGVTGGSGTAAVTTWSNVKFGGGGYVTGLVFHPATANLLYARTDVGGAYRWNQATASWMPITDGLGFGGGEERFHGIESIAVDPNNDQLVYLAAGMYTSGGNGRLYISSDRGDHWTFVGLPFPLAGNSPGRAIGERLTVDPNKPSTLFYATRTAGLWKSVDSGLTWAQVTSLSSAKLTQDQVNALGVGSAVGVELVVFDTGTKGSGSATLTIYAAIAPDYVSTAGLTSNLYKSTNGGASWTPVSTPISGYHIPHMVRAADGMFYVAFATGTGPGANGPAQLYKFDGSNWTLLKDPNAGSSNSGLGLGGVSVSGTGASTRIAIGVTNSWGNYSGEKIIQLSDDGGSTWREIAAMMPHTPADDPFWGWPDDVEIDPSNRDRVLYVHGGGVWETLNASSSTPSWDEPIKGIEETAALALATPPAGAPYIVLNSSGDVGTWVDTDLTTKPTLTPGTSWSNGFGADMAWSDPLYIATMGVVLGNNTAFGYWSGDGGKTWTQFATLAPGAAAHTNQEASIAVTARNNAVWAPAYSVPSYTTDNGATWVPTNLPPVSDIYPRAYHLAADRKNPNKVYAYDSGANWWGTPGKVHVSTDGGHTFTLSQSSVSAGLAPNYFANTSLVVNPNAEGDLWLADGNAVYHSLDSGATWTKLSQFASIMGSNPWPDVQGATLVALGKAAPGAAYSAAVYVVGVVNGVWGVYRSDDAGVTWKRFNDDAHQFGGIGVMAADQNISGRIYVSGTGRGVLYSNHLIPTFQSLSPARLLDTRSGRTTIDTLFAGQGALGAQTELDLTVGDRGGVPSGAAAVVLNVTATDTTTAGFLTAWPADAARPNASNINFVANETIPNLVISKLSADGKVALFNSQGSTDVIADVLGWFPATSGLTSLSPARLLDTRSGRTTVDGVDAGIGALAAQTEFDLPVANRGGVPTSGAGAVVLNVTATGSAGPGFVTAWPSGTARPLTSNLNIDANLTIANLAIVKLGADGKVALWSSVGTDLIADVAGWFATPSELTTFAPARLLDTRVAGGPLAAQSEIDLPVLNVGGVPPTGVDSVVLNVTVTNPTAPGFLTVWPSGTSRPLSSNLNFSPAQTIPNLVIAKVGADGKVAIFNSAGSTQVIVDVYGWFAPSP